MPDPFDTPSPSTDEAARVPFDARFDSECGACGGSIYEGDTICWDGDDYAHTDCASD